MNDSAISAARIYRAQSNGPALHVHDRPVTTPFGLLGTDENALSFALGYTFQRCPPLLQWFLREIGISGVRLPPLKAAEIRLQQRDHSDGDQGITDIEIRLPGQFHVIVEAKVGLAVPSIDQCRRYLPRLEKAEEPVQRLVALVQASDQPFVHSYRREDPRFVGKLVGFDWSRLLGESIRLMLSGSISAEAREWARSFGSFLDQEYEMKAFSTEVWVVPASTTPLWDGGPSLWDLHQKYRLYFDHKQTTVRPLYLAFRVDGRVDSLHRVTHTEYSVPIIDLIPEFEHVDAEWTTLPNTVWHFGPAVPLARPLSSGGKLFTRRVRADLDLLLTCESVRDLEVEMGRRKEGRTSSGGQPGKLTAIRHDFDG